MKKEKKDQKKNVVFRRINGRIVPISIGTAGLGVAANAANTTRVYSRKNVTIDKKKFTFNPQSQVMASKFDMRVDGKKVATASTYFDKQEKGFFGFAWLGTKKSERGKGYAKILSREATRDAVRHGAKYTESQVIHAGSAKAGFKKGRDQFWRETNPNKKTGQSSMIAISKTEALKNIEKSRKKRMKELGVLSKKAGQKMPKNVKNISEAREFLVGVLGKTRARADYLLLSKGYTDSPVFRETKVSGMRKFTKYSKPFRTTKNKVALGLGTVAAIGGFYKGLTNEKRKK